MGLLLLHECLWRSETEPGLLAPGNKWRCEINGRAPDRGLEMSEPNENVLKGYNTCWGGRSPVHIGNWYEQNCAHDELEKSGNLKVKTMLLHMHGNELKSDYTTSSSEYGKTNEPSKRPKSLEIKESVLRAELSKTKPQPFSNQDEPEFVTKRNRDEIRFGLPAGSISNHSLETSFEATKSFKNITGEKRAWTSTMGKSIMQPGITNDPERFTTTNKYFYGSGDELRPLSEVAIETSEKLYNTTKPPTTKFDKNSSFTKPVEYDLDALWK